MSILISNLVIKKRKPVQVIGIQKSIYRRDDEREITMNSSKKATRYSNTKAANIQKPQSYFNTIIDRTRIMLITIATWLSFSGVM